MENLFEYIDWRADLTFSEAPQNKIDGLIFAELSYIPFENVVSAIGEGEEITLAEASRAFFELHGENFSLGAILPHEILLLLKACASSKRFSKVKLWGYVNDICLEVEKQFSAIFSSMSAYASLTDPTNEPVWTPTVTGRYSPPSLRSITRELTFPAASISTSALKSPSMKSSL